MSHHKFAVAILALLLLAPTIGAATGQEKSVRPGINAMFQDPNVKEFQGRFEVESREVFARRDEIVKACQIQPGQTIGDIGAGTGLFTRLFAQQVGSQGRVIAVDISQKFLDHIAEASRKLEQANVETRLCKPDSTELPAQSIDLAFICDTYHHFEFPLSTLASLHKALKPGGRVVLVDFRRVPGQSSDWVLNHVRAGQEVFEAEIAKAGFRKVREEQELLKENYLVVFEKLPASSGLSFPLIAGFGGVVARPNAPDQPRAGAKVVLDVTGDGKPTEPNKGLERAARTLNLYGAAGLKASDVKITVVLHGEATRSVLSDAAFQSRYETERNPNLPLIRALQQAGVEVLVCGQALHYRQIADTEVAADIPIAASAVTAVMNRQRDGYAHLLVP